MMVSQSAMTCFIVEPMACRLAGLMVVLAVLAAAQAPVIRGRVVDAATGNPVARVTVRATAEFNGEAYHAMERTGPDGAFQFQGIVPGSYLVGATKTGFLPRLYGPETPGAPPQYLAVKDGETKDIVLRLRAVTAIRGRVVDEAAEGVSGVQIQRLTRGFERGKEAWVMEETAITDRHGAFRFDEVMPGRYVLMAVPDAGLRAGLPSEIDASRRSEERRYGPAFWGGGREPSDARLVELRAGQELDNVEIALTPQETGAVEVALRGLPSESAFPSLELITDSPWMTYRSRLTYDARKQTAGQSDRLLPGRYHVTGYTEHGSRAHAARVVVDVSPGGTARVELVFAPAVDLDGRVRVEGPGAAEHRKVQVTLIPGSVRQPVASLLQAEPDHEGRFTIRNVPPGVWDIGVEPIPPGGYLKAMTLAGHDVLTEDMTIDSASRGPLEIVLSTQGGVVRGSIEMEDRQTVATVLLLPEGEFAHVISFHQGVETRPGGDFEIKGVTPGTYRLYAFNTIRPWEWLQPGFLDAYREMGTAVEVAEGKTSPADAKLIRRSR
ncbi:MAG TPA: hypothetical protein DEH78_25525 [Solibacterales bacterium]|nr:hypothetical protein [Bryobacterales bacterium]